LKFLEEEIEIGSKAIVMRQGISKTKELLRSKVWFVGIDSRVDEVIQVCHAFTLIYLN